MRRTGCDYTSGWNRAKASAPELYSEMSNEEAPGLGLENAETHEARRQAAAFRLANATSEIVDGASKNDGLIPGWAFKLVGLPPASTLAEFRRKLQDGATMPSQQASALLIQVATTFERRENLVRSASWPKLKEILPEIFSTDAPIWGAYTMASVPGDFSMANSVSVATVRMGDGGNDAYIRSLVPGWALSICGITTDTNDAQSTYLLTQKTGPNLDAPTGLKLARDMAAAIMDKEQVDEPSAVSRLKQLVPAIGKYFGSSKTLENAQGRSVALHNIASRDE